MANYSIEVICKAIGGRLVGDGSVQVDHLAIDSRLNHPHSSTLFVALKGAHHDGHQHVYDMYSAGTTCFLVENEHGLPAEGNYIVVDDTLNALQEIAQWHRRSHNLTAVGITGSNGKTIVKEWLNELIHDAEHVVRSPGSWNSQIGVALSIWNIEEAHTVGLFEAGISRANEMDRLRNMIQPQVGIFTNIGPAHSEGFPDDAAKAKEKGRLFSNCESVVCCADHPLVVQALVSAGINEDKLFMWSRNKKTALQILSEDEAPFGKQCLLQFDGKAHELEIPFSDAASLENVYHCVLTALLLGQSFQDIKERTRKLQPLDMRLQLLEGKEGSTILNDAYSNDPVSLRIALDRLDAIAGSRKKIAVLSTMDDIHHSEIGPDSTVPDLLQRAGLDKIYLVGPQRRIPNTSENEVDFPDTQALLDSLDETDFFGKAILVKGARKYQLERIVKRLQAKSHGAVLQVNLSAIKQNLDAYRDRLDKTTAIMVMLKAFGYGSGAIELARLLEYEKIERIGVAYADEGVQLRKNGISAPIMVMNPADVGWDLFHRFNLQPTVHSIQQLSSVIGYIEAGGNELDIHLELDTGMNRLGMKESELEQLVSLLQQHPMHSVQSIFSHLAASDSSEHDAFTQEQVDCFNRMVNPISTVLDNTPLRHILNSAGISRHPEHQMDMVRLGIGLYGYDRTIGENGLRTALSLSANISQIKVVSEGESIGYDRSFVADISSRIAILPIGYADGLRRSLSNGAGVFWIADRPAPIVGKVCMDMTMINVTGIDCDTGDQAVLFDEKHGMEEICRQLETIPYEVLCSLSTRIERQYVRDA